VVAIADEVAAKKKSTRRIMLSFDEWNVWYRTRRRQGRTIEGWPIAPPILEEVYSMKDALAFGGACISLLNHADRVKAACLAQLVNAIAPILTETGGPAWRQTTFFPFADFSNFGRGTVLLCDVDSPTYSATYHDPRGTTDLQFPMPAVPFLKAAAVHSDRDRSLSFFLLNRNLEEQMSVEIRAEGFSNLVVERATCLSHPDLEAVNTKERPGTVAPVAFSDVSAKDDQLRLQLPPASWNVVKVKES
jgi:alpha-N-arabinofuranosidase